MKIEMKEKRKADFAFFGTDAFALNFLTSLKEKGIVPKLIICGEDKIQGRGLKLTPPPVKTWAIENKIDFLQPKKLDASLTSKLKACNFELFLVASYGKIIPAELLDLPPHKTLNIHPSLLPLLRGPSPIQETILQEIDPGVTIIKLDEKIDHGPILAQKKLETGAQPMKTSVLSPLLANLGAELFSEILTELLAGKIKEKPQDHSKATFTKKIEKEDAFIDLKSSPWENYKKILAYDIWPRAFFFAESKGEKVRVIVTSARFENGNLVIEKVIPQNKKEMSYEDFLKISGI